MKNIIAAILFSLIIVGGAIIFSGQSSERVRDKEVVANNVFLESGKQVVAINARGGYSPRKSIAKAGLPTIVRFNTVNTFDCSSYVFLPSLNVSKTLPQSGSTDIDIGIQPAGQFKGFCSMGMYAFEIEFVE